MANIIEQTICIKFWFHDKISGKKQFEILQKVFKDDCLSKTTLFDWYKKFKAGRASAVDGPRSGRPSNLIDDQEVDKARELTLVDRRLTITDIIEYVPM